MWQKSRLQQLPAPIPGARLALVLAKLAVRAARIARYRRLGRLVVVYRTTYDADVPAATAGWRDRVSAKVLKRVTSEPELAILLDAPAEVTFVRKGEHDLARLRELRSSYLRMAASNPQLVVVNAAEPPEDVRRVATALIWDRLLATDAALRRRMRRR